MTDPLTYRLRQTDVFMFLVFRDAQVLSKTSKSSSSSLKTEGRGGDEEEEETITRK